MKLPYIRPLGRQAVRAEMLGGLNLTEYYRSGQLQGGDHLSSDGSPGLQSRETPLQAGSYADPQGIFANGRAVAAGGQLYLDGQPVGSLSAGPKQTATVGSRVYIFPDKYALDLESGALSAMECRIELADVEFQNNSIAKAGQSWPFAEGDAVEITGCIEHKTNNKTLIIRKVDENGLWFDDNSLEAGSEGAIMLQRTVPDLEVVCESGNRLWGCAGNTIYGSKQGDPLNFYVYDGLVTDSYAVSVSGEEPFTGCAVYGSHILFFKEDLAYKLYGTRPSNYQLMTARIPGVRMGCADTLWTDSEDMYYLGREGLYAYSGGVPQLLSRELGEIGGAHACGGVWMGKYYLSAAVGGQAGIFTYDLRQGGWLPWEMGVQAVGMARSQDGFYMLDGGGRLMMPEGGRAAEYWSAELRPFRDGEGRIAKCTALVIHAELAREGWLAVDQSGPGGIWQQAALFDGGRQGLRIVRLRPNRGSDFGLRLRGWGRCHIRSIERRVTVGGVQG